MRRLRKEFKNSRYWFAFGRHFLEAMGIVGIVVTVLAAFAPDFLPEHLYYLFLFIVVSVLYSIKRMWLKPVRQTFAGGYEVQLIVGDLFEQSGNCFIGMTDTFDVETPDIISLGSIQGQLLERVWGGQTKALSNAISKLLRDFKTTENVNKPGNRSRYPIGTTLDLKHNSGIVYFCTAYAKMDENNNANSTVEYLTTSLYEVWEKTDQVGNQASISVPLVGQGLTRIPGFGAELSLRLIEMTFVLRSNRGKVSNLLKIVVTPEQIKTIDRYEFSSFLRSLANSDKA